MRNLVIAKIKKCQQTFFHVYWHHFAVVNPVPMTALTHIIFHGDFLSHLVDCIISVFVHFNEGIIAILYNGPHFVHHIFVCHAQSSFTILMLHLHSIMPKSKICPILFRKKFPQYNISNQKRNLSRIALKKDR